MEELTRKTEEQAKENGMGERKAGTSEPSLEKLGFQLNHVDRFGEKQPFYHPEIKKLSMEIFELDAFINSGSLNDIPAAIQKMNDMYGKLCQKSEDILSHVGDKGLLENPKFLDSIMVSRINGVLLHQSCSEMDFGRATVTKEDFEKMREKNGVGPLEFKNCDIGHDVCMDGRFENCRFENCSCFATIRQAEFQNTEFTKVTFYNTTMQDVKFGGCKFDGCSNFNVSRPEMETKNIEFSNTKFKNCRMSLGSANMDTSTMNFRSCLVERCKMSIGETCQGIKAEITKRIMSKESLARLLGRDRKKDLKQQAAPQDRKPQRRAGKSH